MTPKQVQAALAAAEARYWAEVDRIAEQVRLENVAPFCERHAVRFTAGMGSWDFNGATASATFRRPQRAWAKWDDSELPARLRCILGAGTVTGQDLGSLTPDFTPANYKPD